MGFGLLLCSYFMLSFMSVAIGDYCFATYILSAMVAVKAIGGLKEKTMAALRHGITTVVIPKDNERDLADIDPVVRNSLNFITASSVETVLEAALNRKAETIPPAILSSIPEDVKKSRKPGIRQ